MNGIAGAARVVSGVLLAAFGAGCAATAPPSKPAVVFPSRDEVARIPSQVPRAEAFGTDDVAVDTWSFESQASTDAAAYDDPSPWGDVVRELVKGHEATVTPSAPLKCAAQELARFQAKNGAMPTESLRRFMAARCGAVTTGLTPVFLSVTTPSAVPDEELAPKARAGFAKRLGARLGAGHHLLAVGAARDAQRTSVVAVLSQDEARLEPGTLGVDDATANRAAVGLLAGWEVPGLIRSGNFLLAAVGTSDVTAWLDFALERPIGRSSLLDPGARQVAIGPAMPPGGGALGAAVTTYALFDSEDHAGEAARFFQRVAVARAARGLPAPVRVQGLGEMDAELGRVAREGAAPMDALQATMQVAVARTGQGVHGYTLETSDVDQGDVPDALLSPGPLRLMVGVTHHRAEGAAWGQYVVIVVVLGAGGGE